MVEDVFRTQGLVNGKYPGICEHCGKTGIRYMAHVRQHLGDTLRRALGNETDNGPAIAVRDEDLDSMSAALLDAKEWKQVNVGCVCVAKYLTDCGVDHGRAALVQKEVLRITHTLQEIASLESEKERTAEALSAFALVTVFADRARKLATFPYWNCPLLKGNSEATQAFFSLRAKARNDYEKMAERWKREAHGYPARFYADRTPTTAQLLAYYDRQIDTHVRKLETYKRGVEYV